MKYIDAEKLIAEIESRMEDCKLPDGRFPTTTNIVRYEELSCLRNFIASLQQEQPEVDLDKEIDTYTTEQYHKIFDGTGTLDEFDWEDIASVIEEVARHFYELGLKAKED